MMYRNDSAVGYNENDKRKKQYEVKTWQTVEDVIVKHLLLSFILAWCSFLQWIIDSSMEIIAINIFQGKQDWYHGW